MKFTIIVDNREDYFHEENSGIYYPEVSDVKPPRLLPDWIQRYRIRNIVGYWLDAGIDIRITTASHTIFNEIRIMIKQGVIKPDQIEIIYIDENGIEVSPVLDSDGRLDTRPDGFFDVYSLQLRELM